MRAMVRGLAERIDGPSTFTIVHQFADADSEVDLGPGVRYLPMRISLLEYLRLGVFAALRLVGLRVPAVAGPHGRRIIDAIGDADLVVSAPGGPYFGDLYADHELAHWLMIWIASWDGRPLMLYAPSCGPFANRLLAPFRRAGFRRFDRICLREALSAEMLRDFAAIEATVTTDSALQDEVPPTDRSAWCADGERLLVIAVRDPGDPTRARHDDAVVAAAEAVAADGPTSMVFLPQLHGTTHRDAPYLSTLADRIDGASRVAVAPETLDSRDQRALIAAADLVIAGRYHPAVFSIAAGTPVAVLAYEHKAMGVAAAAGIEEWASWVDDVSADELVARSRDLLARSAEVREILQQSGPRLRELAGQTSDVAASLVGGGP